jgi:hypothetical protein
MSKSLAFLFLIAFAVFWGRLVFLDVWGAALFLGSGKSGISEKYCKKVRKPSGKIFYNQSKIEI